MSIFTKTVVIFFMFTSTLAFAKTETNIAKPNAKITKNITAKMKVLNLQISSMKNSVIKGLYQVQTNQGVFYVSADGNYLINGSIYDLNNNMRNVTEKSLDAWRLKKLKSFEPDMIIYKAKNQKHVITVFTDTSCAYCKKLHSQISDYNKLGITVRYLAFPRSGINSPTYDTMVSIWCAKDRKLAMNNSKKGKSVVSKTCKNTVKEQYELGVSFGVRGTPAIILDDGSMKAGYLPPENLLTVIQQSKKAK
ncbi:MAG: bifunctional protein-disulfide isomerase/oxidoreductase DsbC [Psychromonas sp.]|nr:bifunctional protein-disulfide isomerase/oxidoreductase DsbC [Psychromonas sp.]